MKYTTPKKLPRHIVLCPENHQVTKYDQLHTATMFNVISN